MGGVINKQVFSQKEVDAGSYIIPVTEQKGVFKVGYGSPDSRPVEPY